MYFAYRGWSIILIAPFFAGLAALASMFDILPVYSELYMTRLAEYVKTYYPVFLFGAVFAKLMEKGGLASAIAGKIVDVLGEKRAILAVLMGCGALTYGGLSVFVVAFVMYPFGAVVFKKADIPKRLLPAALPRHKARPLATCAPPETMSALFVPATPTCVSSFPPVNEVPSPVNSTAALLKPDPP